MKEPIVSVLMTAYNREAYLAEAIESVIASSFSDYELIIVDDGSTDDSAQIARDYANRYEQIRFYQNTDNLGDYPNRKQAASYARGRYLKYVDSDDKIYPHCLQVMVEAMEQFPEAALGLCHTAPKDITLPQQVSAHQAYTQTYLSKENGIFGNSPLSTIIRHTAYDTVGGFSGANYIGDGELWLKLGAHYPSVLLPTGLTWWRSHGEQQSTYAQDGRQATLGYLKDLNALEDTHCPLNENERKAALSNCRRRQSRQILRLYAGGQFKLARNIQRGSNIGGLTLLCAFF